MRASTNPLAYCEGGFYGGHLEAVGQDQTDQKPLPRRSVSPRLTSCRLYNGKSLAEDGQFALETLQYINDKVEQFKNEDGNLYAIYGTLAESLCGLQVEQFRKKYGIIEGVSDRPYVSNSFHCHVTEDLTPIQKQDLEGRFWNLCNGGKIQYVKYPIDYNHEAIRSRCAAPWQRASMRVSIFHSRTAMTAVMRSCLWMSAGSVRQPQPYQNRENERLSFPTRVKGDTRLNDAKMAEIAERKSM